MRKLAWVSLFSSLSWLSACDGGGPIPLADLGDRLASAYCASLVRCNHTPSQSACVAASPYLFSLDQVVADVNAGKVKYDAAATADCIDYLSTFGCNFNDAFAPPPDACDRAFEGTVADGGACFTSVQCVSEDCDIGTCDPSVGCCMGTCKPPPTIVATGGACLSAGLRCADGTFCKITPPAMGFCTVKSAAGQPCAGLNECATGLWCHRPANATESVCMRLPARGESCEVGTFPCSSGADSCDAVTHTCVERLAPGGACLTSADCVSYANCDAVTKTCVAQGNLGDACVSTRKDCLGALVCTNAVCSAPARRPVCQ